MMWYLILGILIGLVFSYLARKFFYQKLFAYIWGANHNIKSSELLKFWPYQASHSVITQSSYVLLIPNYGSKLNGVSVISSQDFKDVAEIQQVVSKAEDKLLLKEN